MLSKPGSKFQLIDSFLKSQKLIYKKINFISDLSQARTRFTLSYILPIFGNVFNFLDQ